MKRYLARFRFSQPVGAVVLPFGVILVTVGADNTFRIEGWVLIALAVIALVFGGRIDRWFFPDYFFEEDVNT